MSPEPSLKEIGQFNANYLHLDRTESGDPAVVDRVGDLIEPSPQFSGFSAGMEQ